MAVRLTKKKWMWVLGGLLILAGLYLLMPDLKQVPYIELVLKIAMVAAGVLILIDW
jgi:uncharacterized membrane protein HdeD (DUF308 family)